MTRIAHRDCHCCRVQRKRVEIQAQPHTALCVRGTDSAAGAKDLEVLEREIGCLVVFAKGTLPVAECREEV